jgi:hypothetical protein
MRTVGFSSNRGLIGGARVGTMCDVFHLNCRCRPRFDPDAEIQMDPPNAQLMLEPTASRIYGSFVQWQLVQFDVGGNSALSIAHRAYQPTQ